MARALGHGGEWRSLPGFGARVAEKGLWGAEPGRARSGAVCAEAQNGARRAFGCGAMMGSGRGGRAAPTASIPVSRSFWFVPRGLGRGEDSLGLSPGGCMALGRSAVVVLAFLVGTVGRSFPVRGATWCLGHAKFSFLFFSSPFCFVFGHRLFYIQLIRSYLAFYG